MHSVFVRYSAFFVALFGLIASFGFGLVWTPAPWGLVLFLPLTALGLADFAQKRHSLWRNFPVISRVRWMFDDLRPFIHSYVVEGDQDGRPFNREQRALVYARAKGQNDTKPFGSVMDVYAGEHRWFAHSMAPAPLDQSPRVLVGGPQCTQPYAASLFNISAMSFGSLSARAIEALNLAAARGGFYHDTGEGSISPYHRKHGGDLVWEIGSGYFGCRDIHGAFDPACFERNAKSDQVKMIEIKLSQGAKPGHGGMLPGAKVTAEIAETRGVPKGFDCISPAAHGAFSSPRELVEFADRLRRLSGGKPVGIKLCVGHPHEFIAIVKAMLQTGLLLDFVVVDGSEGGTGAAPLELANHFGAPMKEGLTLVRNTLVGAGLRAHIRIAAAGKVHSAVGIATNCALGADWSNAARAFMFTLGCVQSLRCHKGDCPTGVATQDRSLQRGLVVEDKAERARRFHEKTLHALAEITSAAGLAHPGEFTLQHLHRHPLGGVTELADYPVIGENMLLKDPDATPYAVYWRAASTETFRAAA